MYTLFNRQQYFDDLIARIKDVKSGDRLLFMTMSIDFIDKAMIEFKQALIEAANKGARVVLLLDSYTFMLGGKLKFGPLFYSNNISLCFKNSVFYQTNRTISELIKQGVEVKILNAPLRKFSNPFKGRSHIKLSIINDDIFIGGINLISDKTCDVMVLFNDKKIADQLYLLGLNILSKGYSNKAIEDDFFLPINQTDQIIIDKGLPNKSLIFDSAIKLINEAKDDLLLICQFFPDKQLILPLRDAYNRGVKVRIIFNNFSKHKFPFNILHFLVVFYFKLKLPKVFFKSEVPIDRYFLHAKVLISDKTAMIGSHNFVYTGVKFGTSEICLISNNRLLSKNLKDFSDSLIK